MVLATLLLERGLNSGPTDGKIYSQANAERVRIIATVLGSLSVIADAFAIFWFMRMKRKWRHSLIILLLIADLLKDVNYIAFTAVAFIQKTVQSNSPVCQATGFFNTYFIEMTDWVILTIVVHMSVQILQPKLQQDGSEGGLVRWKTWIIAAIVTVPFIMACIAFANRSGGYQLVGAFCGLPVRPFWYRLALSWIPRYMIAIAIVVLTVIIRIRVRGYQAKLAQLQASMPTQGNVEAGAIQEVDELEDSDDEGAGAAEKRPVSANMDVRVDEKRMTQFSMMEEVPPVPPMPQEHQQFNANDLRKFKRMSYKRRQLPAIETTTADRTASIGAPSVAASSAVFASPVRGDRGVDLQRTITGADTPETPARRKSIGNGELMRRSQSVIDFSARRASVIETSSRTGSITRGGQGPFSGNADRMSSVHSTGRRSSIWDEIDASLEKKVANPNRMSIFTITGSEAGGDVEAVTYETDNQAYASRPVSMAGSMRPTSMLIDSNRLSRVPSRNSLRNSRRSSKMYDVARRTMSIISLRGAGEAEEAPDSPGAILRRRHRYIQRQLRFLMVYPILYLLLWLCPFVLHALQYDDAFAEHPPFPIAVLSTVSVTIFGFVNSVAFCMREKPWTAIPDSDGTMRGSFVGWGPVLAARGVWYRITGKEDDEGFDFVG